VNQLEILARLIADLYGQIIHLTAELERKEAELDEMARQVRGQTPNRAAEETARAEGSPPPTT
jgi:hypothetical protein